MHVNVATEALAGLTAYQGVIYLEPLV